MKPTALLFLYICILAYSGDVQAECCNESFTMLYVVDDGNCADAGGKGGYYGCSIVICADGKPRRGSFCGRGSCNIFGCNCDNGCITGDWKQSFLDINQNLKLTITEQYWS